MSFFVKMSIYCGITILILVYGNLRYLYGIKKKNEKAESAGIRWTMAGICLFMFGPINLWILHYLF